MGFIDMLPSHWAAKDVNDLVDVNLYGYGKFIKSIAYNVFQLSYPAFDEVFKTTKSGNEINLGVALTESVENPIAVFLNGIEIGYTYLDVDLSGNTVVVLRRNVPVGSLVRVIALGCCVL
jgi:hypothetical protein